MPLGLAGKPNCYKAAFSKKKRGVIYIEQLVKKQVPSMFCFSVNYVHNIGAKHNIYETKKRD